VMEVVVWWNRFYRSLGTWQEIGFFSEFIGNCRVLSLGLVHSCCCAGNKLRRLKGQRREASQSPHGNLYKAC
jgi:hypothetical protein